MAGSGPRAAALALGAVRHASAAPAAAASAASAFRPIISASPAAAAAKAAGVAESLAGDGLLHRLIRPTASGPIVHQAVLPQQAGAKSAWKPESIRVGVLGYKAGMTADWDKWGVRRALTVVQVRARERGGKGEREPPSPTSLAHPLPTPSSSPSPPPFHLRSSTM
jgi:hypothetical protein